jgi:hypothetical protein
MNLLPRFVIAAIAAATLIAPAAESQAAVILSLGDQTAVTLDPSETVVLPVFVDFTGADRATLIADGGLYSAAALLTRQDAASADASFIADATLTPSLSGGFSETVLYGAAPFASASLYGEIVNLNAGAFGTDDGTTTRIQLGTFTLTGSAVPGRSDTFILSILDPQVDYITSNAVAFAQRDPATFDSLVQPVNVSVSVVVPEPTVALPLIAAAGLFARRRRA